MSSTSASTPAAPAVAARGILLMVAAMGCLASMDAASKSLVDDYSVWQLLFVRHAVLLVFCLAWFGPLRAAGALRSRRPVLQIVRVTALVVEMALFMLAIRHLPLADTHAILAASPLVVTALAWPVLGEAVGPRRWAAVMVGFVGVLIIIRPGSTVFQAAALLPLLGAGLWAVYQVLTRLTARDDSGLTAFMYLVVAGVAGPGVVMPWLWVTPGSWADVSLFAAVAAFGALGHVCLLLSLRTAPASTLQPFSYTLLIWATLWGFVFFGDVPDLWTWLGGVTVVASGLYTWQRERRTTRG
ncbi:MAG: DMT family transporter [Pseudomonadota bacterium]